jgi:glycosyltransferase involved in cell wall biosynthesis
MTLGLTTAQSVESPAFCTIICKNYISQARALAESLRSVHPGSSLYVLLVDRVDGYFNPADEPFRMISVEDLAIPDFRRFCFQYNVLELSTAAKPYFLARLLRAYRPKKLVYFDPDILVLRPLDGLSRALDDANIVLTPHLTQPYPRDGKCLDELAILLAGTYNLGFIGVANTPEVERFLAWWQDRLYDGCQINQAAGLFVDQRWIDLAAHYFEGVRVLREPGYNVAYWNLHYRLLTLDGGEIRVNGGPAYFMHFSGFRPSRPDEISKHQNRLTMDDIGDGRRLFARYTDALYRHGYRQSIDWPYAFGSFDNGVPVPDVARRLYLRLGDEAIRFGNPFVTEGPVNFFHWMTAETGDRIAPVLGLVHQSRPDVMQAFPDVNGAHRKAFRQWITDYGRHHDAYALSDGLLARLGFAPAAATASGPIHATPADPAPLFMVRKGDGPPRPFGVNLAGYLESEKGVGEAARAVIRALEAARIPYVLNNVRDSASRNIDARYSHFSDANPYAVNIIQVNADAALGLLPGRMEYLAGRYNIGIWNWELCEFPTQWDGSFQYFDEVWAPSTFCQHAFAARSPIPIRYVPYSVTTPKALPRGVGRGFFGLPSEPFLFLFAFDFQSFIERKNPQAVLEAFVRAFGDRNDVLLVFKTVHASDNEEDYARLHDACRRRSNVQILDRVYTRAEAHSLMMLCDAYVSLHRSEGFGLTIAEAMAMGKPVIATAYSANADWMTIANSRPVRYQLRTLDRDWGPYFRGAVWADADVEDAARQMRRLVEDRALAARIGAQAREDIARLLSPARIGEVIYSLLANLVAEAGPAGPARVLKTRRGGENRHGLPLPAARRAA